MHRAFVASAVLALAFVASALLALAVIAPGTGALSLPGPPKTRVDVTPAEGSSTATFMLRFRAPERTGRYGSSQRLDLITALAPMSARGCITSLSITSPSGGVPPARAGERVRVALTPSRLGGRWCAGTYHGRIEEIETARCPRGKLCPGYVRLLGIVGRFTLQVAQGPSGGPPPAGTDTTPPSFAGLQAAFACTPGPQRPGQTTPLALSWPAASDDLTPSPQIVYEIYAAARPGGEDFSTPTWTTPAGATTYRTPGLPSHGSYYFVVRARDGAGNQDHNTVERRGVDPCY